MAAATSTRLFDRWSDSYDRPGLQRLTYRPVHDAVLGRVRGSEPRIVVDLGCGTGQLTRRLVGAFPGAAVVGIDRSPGMLEQAVRRVEQAGAVGLVLADAAGLPLAPDSVDLVTCVESFHWYPDPGAVLAGLAVVLRPGGRLVVASTAAVTPVGERLVRRATARRNEVRAAPPGRMRSMLEDAGFEVVHQRRVPRLSPIGWPVLTDAIRR